MTEMRVGVDQDACAMCGLCAMEVPELFDQGDNDGLGRVIVDGTPVDDPLTAPVPRELQPDVKELVRTCAGEAIYIATRE